MKKSFVALLVCFLCLITEGAEKGKFSFTIGTNTTGEETFTFSDSDNKNTLETLSNLSTNGKTHSFSLELVSSIQYVDGFVPEKYAMKAGMHGNARLINAEISKTSVILNESMGQITKKTELEISGKVFLLDNNIFSTYNLLPNLMKGKEPVSFTALVPQLRKALPATFKFEKSEVVEIMGEKIRLGKYTVKLGEKDIVELWYDGDNELVKLEIKGKLVSVNRIDYKAVSLN